VIESLVARYVAQKTLSRGLAPAGTNHDFVERRAQATFPSVKRRSSYGSSHLRIVDRYAGFDVLELSR